MSYRAALAAADNEYTTLSSMPHRLLHRLWLSHLVVVAPVLALAWLNGVTALNLLVATGVGIAFAWLVAKRMTHDIGRPIRAVTAGIEQVAHGKYAPLPTGTYPLEVEPTVTAFNRMVLALAAQERAFQTLNSELSRRAREMNGLYEVSRSVTSSLESAQVLQLILRETVKSFPTARKGIIHLLDDATQRLFPYALSNGTTAMDTPSSLTLDQSIVGHVIRQRQPIVVSDTEALPDFQGSVGAVRSLMVMPLAIGERVIGAFTLDSDQPGAFTHSMSATFRSLANQAATALENARLYSESQMRVEELTRLYHSALALAQPTPPDQLPKQLVSEAMALLDVPAAALYRISAPDAPVTSGNFDELCSHPDVQALLPTLLADQSLLGHATERSVTTAADPIHLLAVPIHQESKLWGTLVLATRAVAPFDAQATRLASHFAQQAAAALVNARLLATRDLEGASADDEQRRKTTQRADYLEHLTEALGASLATLRLGAEQLLNDELGPLTPAQQHHATHLLTETRRLHETVKSVSDLLKLEAGQLQLQVEPFIVAHALKEVRDSLTPAMAQKHQQLRVIGDASFSLFGDRQRFTQMIHQLMASAVHATPQGGLVTLRVARQGDALILSVRDSGVGVPTAQQAHLFEPFYSRPGGRGPLSEGVALPLARHIAALHGGTLTVKSVPGQGSTITLQLPSSDLLPVRWPDRHRAREARA